MLLKLINKASVLGWWVEWQNQLHYPDKKNYACFCICLIYHISGIYKKAIQGIWDGPLGHCIHCLIELNYIKHGIILIPWVMLLKCEFILCQFFVVDVYLEAVSVRINIQWLQPVKTATQHPAWTTISIKIQDWFAVFLKRYLVYLYEIQLRIIIERQGIWKKKRSAPPTHIMAITICLLESK